MGYDVTKEELGGWQIHRNDMIDNLAESETEAIAIAQRFLSYLPQSVYGIPPHVPASSGDSPDRKEAELRYLIPRNRQRRLIFGASFAWLLIMIVFSRSDQCGVAIKSRAHPLTVTLWA